MNGSIPTGLAVTALLVSAAPVGAVQFGGWLIDENYSAHAVGGYIGYMDRQVARTWVLFTKSADGQLSASAGVEGCSEERDLPDLTAQSQAEGEGRATPIRHAVSAAMAELAVVCRTPKPSDRIFFRQFDQALEYFMR